MRTIYRRELDSLKDIPDPGHRFDYAFAIERSILQCAALVALEYYARAFRGFATCNVVELARQMLSPGDSTPIDTLDRLIPLFRQNGWSACAKGWFEPYPFEAPVLIPGQHNYTPLVRTLNEWVAFRNDRSHGVVDAQTVASKVKRLEGVAASTVDVLNDLIPIVTANDGALVISAPEGEVPIESLKIVDGKAIVIRRIQKTTDSWKLVYHTLNQETSSKGYYLLPNSIPLLTLQTGLGLRYGQRSVAFTQSIWRPLVLLPDRQTTVFEGRTEERMGLLDWYDDPDSRACLVFGDGGVGKTTLVLEFLNDILDIPQREHHFKPDIICFYSAKLTRWTENGVEHFRGRAPAIADAVRDVVRAIEDVLDKEWFSYAPEPLVDRAATLLSDMGLSRNSVLLVLDNTETLAQRPGEEKDIARLIARVTSRLARVLITSRRRELVEARPIEVLPMDEETGLKLLRRLADEYEAMPLSRAGDPRLRKISRDLGGKPLLLNVLARYIGHTNQSLDLGYKKILSDAKAGLTEFLYEDVWRRISGEQRNVFMALSILEVPLDSTTIGWICAETGVAHSIFQTALDENYLGYIAEYGTDYDLVLNVMAREFFQIRLQELRSGTVEAKMLSDVIDKVVKTTTQRYKSLQIAERSSVSDRIAEAFRTGPAKAAKLATRRGDLEEAEEWFLEAIRLDSDNAALFDRMAFFLMHYRHDTNKAKGYAEKATNLDPKYPEAFFTLGTILHWQDRIEEGDKKIDGAEARGYPREACLYQKARARIEKARRTHNLAGATGLLDEAEEYIVSAIRNAKEEKYYKKTVSDCKEQLELIRWLRESRGRRTRNVYHGPKGKRGRG